jgi:hypothetical protein
MKFAAIYAPFLALDTFVSNIFSEYSVSIEFFLSFNKFIGQLSEYRLKVEQKNGYYGNTEQNFNR